MSIVLLNQVVMVAQNITSQELHYATKRGWSRCLHFAYNNINNRGVIRNVFDFVRGRRRNEHSYGTMCAWNVLYQRELSDELEQQNITYRKTFDIRRTLVGNKLVDHSDVVGASPVGAAQTTSSFST